MSPKEKIRAAQYNSSDVIPILLKEGAAFTPIEDVKGRYRSMY